MSETLAIGVVEKHLLDIQSVFPDATGSARPDGTTVIHVPTVPLPPQWQQSTTGIWFLAPVGYPMAAPDCFWANADLALKSGVPLKNAHQQVPPFGGTVLLWFSWHVQRWNPQTDTMRTYLRVIRDRLSRAE